MLGRGLAGNVAGAAYAAKPALHPPQINRERHPSPALHLPAAKGGGVVPSHARQRTCRQCFRSGIRREAGVASTADQPGIAPLPNPPLACGKGRGCSAEPCSAGALRAMLQERHTPRSWRCIHCRSTANSTPPQSSPCLRQKEGRSAEPCSAGALLAVSQR